MLVMGPTKNSDGGHVVFGRYSSGELAMQILDDHDMPEMTITVSMVPSGAPVPDSPYIWVKDWSENEGVVEALVESGIAEKTDSIFTINEYCSAKFMKLTDVACEELKKQMEGKNAV